MTGNQLAKFGVAAWGTRWKTPVRDALGVSREMLWRYETGATPISEELAGKFRKLFAKQLQKQRDQIDALLKTL